MERFAARCLRAVRRKFLEDCAAALPASGDGDAEIGRCLRQLTKEAESFRDWLEGELPQGDNTVGRRLLELAEKSLVGGLFLLYLQQRHGELFREFPASEHGDAARRSEADRAAAAQTTIIQAIESAVQRQRLVLDSDVEKGESSAEAAHRLTGQVARCCQNATGALLRLRRAAETLSQPLDGDEHEEQPAPVSAGKLAHRFLSARAVSARDHPARRSTWFWRRTSRAAFPPCDAAILTAVRKRKRPTNGSSSAASRAGAGLPFPPRSQFRSRRFLGRRAR